ncbi:hypothetical protein WJX82_001495 [Trebouxia sp. C0006]
MAHPLHLLSTRLSQPQSLVDDLLDDDFTPEELSLVQQLLPPERFLRVLTALRETTGHFVGPSKNSTADSFTTPVQQVQPQWLLTQSSPFTPRGQGQAISPCSDDEGVSSQGQVSTPPRQFATAAEEFRNRLGHAAEPHSGSWSSDDEDEQISSAADAAEEEGAAVAAVAGRLQSVHDGLASAQGRLAELTGRRPVNRQLEAAEVEDQGADLAMQEGSNAHPSEPRGVADIIRRAPGLRASHSSALRGPRIHQGFLPYGQGQGSLVMPQLRDQGSSMRGDLWLPQQWLEPDEQLPEVEAAAASPRDRMRTAMEAVRAAERAVKAAAVLSPTRQG